MNPESFVFNFRGSYYFRVSSYELTHEYMKGDISSLREVGDRKLP